MSIRNVSGAGGGGGGSAGNAGGRGLGPAPRQVGVRDLPAEAQRAHELLVALGELDRAARAKVLGAAGSRVCLATSTSSEPPSNGNCPVSATYSATPTASQSAASVSGEPDACSGDM
jgi:hypothetical protein